MEQPQENLGRIYGHDLQRLLSQKIITKVSLKRPLYLRLNPDQTLRLTQTESHEMIPTIREVTGYVTGYRIGSSIDDESFLRINPFGPSNLCVGEEAEKRIGDITVSLQFVNSIEKAL